MPTVTNGRLVFKEIPTGFPEPGKSTVYDEKQTIDLENAPLGGGVLVKVLVLSIDPYIRGKMRDPSIQSYTPAFVLGEPLYNHGVGVVLRSDDNDVRTGDYIYGLLSFQQYVILKNPKTTVGDFRVLHNTEKIPWSLYAGVAGMPGKTGYFGWKEYSKAKKGDRVFVSGGAGPVGSLVVQLAKAEGLKVITSAGSESKIAFLKSLGADVAFNYKTTKTLDVLAKEGPIDVYWDNVGGETLDAALVSATVGARFIECGMISGYNDAAPPVKNLMQIVSRQLKISGFLYSHPSLLAKYEDEFYQVIPKGLADGKIKYIEDLTNGLANAGHAILDVQTGKNVGKSVVVVAKE